MIIRTLDFTLNIGSMMFWLLFYAMGAISITQNPQILNDLITGMVQTPIAHNLSWLFILSACLWVANKAWYPIRTILIRILNI